MELTKEDLIERIYELDLGSDIVQTFEDAKTIEDGIHSLKFGISALKDALFFLESELGIMPTLPKICIEVEGGIVQAVSTSEPMEYVIVDLDLPETQEVDWESEIVPNPSDSVFENIYEGWEDCDPANEGVYKAMKAINF